MTTDHPRSGMEHAILAVSGLTAIGLIIVIGLQLHTIRRIEDMADIEQDLVDAENELAAAVADSVAELEELATDFTTLSAQLAAAQSSGDDAAIAAATTAIKDKAAALESAVAAAKAATTAQTVPTVPTAPAIVLTFTPEALPDAVIGQPYSAQVTADGGTPPYAYSSATLPAGLSLGAGGGISGTPSGPAAEAPVEIMAHDGNGAPGTIDYTLNVVDPAAVVEPEPEPQPDPVESEPQAEAGETDGA